MPPARRRSPVGLSRFPDPYQSRDDLSHATVFLVALLLLVSVGGVLFFGNSWLFVPVSSAAPSSLLPTAIARAPSRPTPAPVATFVAPTPVPPLAGIPLVDKASLTTPTPGSVDATPTAGPFFTPTPLPNVVQSSGQVANTGGDGVYLR